MIEQMEFLGMPLLHLEGLENLLFRFAFNTFMVWLIVHKLYYPKSKRSDYYFTYMLMGMSVFFLIYLLGDFQLNIELALGLFAIFGIIRYRTEAMHVREMTFLFVIISLSIVNAVANSIGLISLIIANLIFIGSIILFESNFLHHQYATKLIKYDRIDLITPEKRTELIADLEKRTGLQIKKLEIGGIDFLKDMALIKIFYTPAEDEDNTIGNAFNLKDGEKIIQ